MDFFDIGGGFDGGGLFDGLSDMFFGNMEGGGLFEALLGDVGAFGDLFGGALGEAEVGEILGGMGRAATAETGFFEAFGTATDMAFDYLIWRDVFGHADGFSDFQHAASDQATKQMLEEIREVVKGHGFMLRQLRNHQAIEGIAPILAEYESLGTTLPSEDLAKRAHHALAKVLHPDKDPANAPLMSQLNQAKEALLNPKQRQAYESSVGRDPEAMAKWFKTMGQTDWEETFRAMANKTRLRLPGPPPKPLEGASKWFAERSPHLQGGLIFAGLAGLGVGTYLLAKTFEKKHATSTARHDKWADALDQESSKQTTITR